MRARALFQSFARRWSRGSGRRNSHPKSLRFEALEKRELFSLSGVPVLNSHPRATNTVYLDFDSQTFVPKSGDRQGQTVTLDPFNFDNDLHKIGPVEQQMIEDIHARLSEDFAPFNVNITTVAPKDPNSKGGVNHTWRVALSTIDTDAGFPLNVDPNGNPTGQPSGGFGVIPGIPVVWTQAIGGNSAQCATTAAHELGHQLGLKHHPVVNSLGQVTNEYSPGPVGDDWAPIMGNNLSDRRTIWWNQSYSTVNHGSWSQNDMNVIASKFGWRKDDHGGGAVTATALGQASPAWTLEAKGIIGRTTDVDGFSFIHPGGALHIEANTLTPLLQAGFPAANLDARLELRSANGASLNVVNDPAHSLNATIDTNLPAGTYVVLVAGHGDYADVGQYDLRVQATTILPDQFDDQSPAGEPRNDSLVTTAVIPDVVSGWQTVTIDNLNFDPLPDEGDIDFFTVQLDEADPNRLPMNVPGAAYDPSALRISLVPDSVLGVDRDFEVTVYQNNHPLYVVAGQELVLTNPYVSFPDGRITFSVRDPEGINFYAMNLAYSYAQVSTPELLYDLPLLDIVPPELGGDPLWFDLPYPIDSPVARTGLADARLMPIVDQSLTESRAVSLFPMATPALPDTTLNDRLGLELSLVSRRAALAEAIADPKLFDAVGRHPSIEAAVNQFARDVAFR